MTETGIEIINYDADWHKDNPTDEIGLDVFWHIVNKVVMPILILNAPEIFLEVLSFGKA